MPKSTTLGRDSAPQEKRGTTADLGADRESVLLRSSSTDGESGKNHSKWPVYLWPNLLSLDAPLIAVLWQLLLAQALHVQTGWREPLALFCAVWTIYIADRLFDAVRPAPAGWEPERKTFYRKHSTLMASIGVAAGLCATILALYSPFIRSFSTAMVTLSGCVLSYFGLVHTRAFKKLPNWPRELTVSIIFSVGTFLPVAFSYRAKSQTLAYATLFALLCWVNTSVIEAEEWSRNRHTRQPGLLARFIRAHGTPALSMIAGLSLLFSFSGFLSAEFSLAVLTACTFLFVITLFRSRVSAPLFRAAMDGALCSPAVLLFVHHLG